MPSSRGPAVTFRMCSWRSLHPTEAALLYSTYLGGTGGDSAADIAVDSLGAAYVVGNTTSPDFPSVNPLPVTGGGC